MTVECPACGHRFAPEGDRDLGTYCPDCGHGFHY